MKLRLTDNTYIDTALWSASSLSSEGDPDKALSWALVDKTA